MHETLFDSHCHLMHQRFAEDRAATVDRARSAGITQMLFIGTCPTTSQQAIDLAKVYNQCFASVGISPHDSADFHDSKMEGIEHLAKDPHVVAIGEIGLEYHYDFSPRPDQQEALRHQLRLAKKIDKPVIFHHRDAGEDFRRIIEEEGLPKAGGVMHCFTGDETMLHWALEQGLYISYAGMITFRNSESLRHLLHQTPLERLLLETDSPYLAPTPHRGKRCEPAMILETARVAATVLGLSLDDVARITRRNTERLFKLMTIAPPQTIYAIRRSLYLNITNECPNRCVFCVRFQDRELKGFNLKLDREPTLDEVIGAVASQKLDDYEEIVFCGYGEPTCRMDVVIEVSEYLKRRGHRVRLNTNGLGNLINQSDIVPDLCGRVDAVSVSLNAPDPEQYQQICQSHFGQSAWHAMTLFIQKCVAAGIQTQASIVELPEIDVDACQRLADKLGVPLQRRRYFGPPLESH